MKGRNGKSPLGAHAVAVALLAAALAPACGRDQAVVGGFCAPGYTQCGVRCIDLASDPDNCGACGAACAPGARCVSGTCQGATYDGAIDDGAEGNDGTADLDGPADDGGRDGGLDDGDETGTDLGDSAGSDGPTSDGTLGDGTSGDGTARDGTAGDGTAGEGAPSDGTSGDEGAFDGSNDGPNADTADACVPPYDSPSHCGSCTNTCVAPTPFCALVGSTFTCVPQCTPPLVDCGGSCADLTSDPANCGSCGTVCPSQICAASMCVGSIAGGLVFIGHDYANAIAGTSQARVLSNAVFLWPNDPIRVLSYERYADPAVVLRIKDVLGAAAGRYGRTLDVRSTVNDSDVTGSLSTRNFGVMFVPDQVSAPGAALAALGTSWAPVLKAFTASGGIVVMLDGGSGAMQMPALVTATGLLAVTGQTALTAGMNLGVTAPADAVSLGVLSPYAAGSNSVTIATEPAAGPVTYVVEPVGDGAPQPPVVVHKVF